MRFSAEQTMFIIGVSTGVMLAIGGNILLQVLIHS